jgi:hypothetical protein
MSKPPTEKQLEFLRRNGIDCSHFTRSQASIAISKLNYFWNPYNIDDFLDSFETNANLSHTIPNVI